MKPFPSTDLCDPLGLFCGSAGTVVVSRSLQQRDDEVLEMATQFVLDIVLQPTTEH